MACKETATSFTSELEDFIDSEEGRFWLECHGWAKVSKVIDEALVLPMISADVIEDAIVLVGGDVLDEIRRDDRDERGHPAQAELGILGKVALVEAAPSGDRGRARDGPGKD